MIELPPFPDALRATLSPEVARYIAALEAAVQTLTSANAALTGRVAELEARLGQTSANSSRPPSSDPPGAHRPARPARGARRPGGQPGHPGHARTLRPVEDVDAVVQVLPADCATLWRHPAGGGWCG